MPKNNALIDAIILDGDLNMDINVIKTCLIKIIKTYLEDACVV